MPASLSNGPRTLHVRPGTSWDGLARPPSTGEFRAGVGLIRAVQIPRGRRLSHLISRIEGRKEGETRSAFPVLGFRTNWWTKTRSRRRLLCVGKHRTSDVAEEMQVPRRGHALSALLLRRLVACGPQKVGSAAAESRTRSRTREPRKGGVLRRTVPIQQAAWPSGQGAGRS